MKKLLKARDRLYRKDKQANKSRLNDINSKLKNLKHKIRRESRAAYWNYIESIIVPEEQAQAQAKDTKKLLTIIKHMKSDSVGIASPKDNGVLKDSPKEEAEILNAQFKSVFTKEKTLEGELSHQATANNVYPDIGELQITTQGIQKLLENLHPNKAMGPDELYP